MLLTLETTHEPATDLGFLLHKNPAAIHEQSLSFGKALVFYPIAEQSRCQVALLLEVDPIAIVRRTYALKDLSYVNDRPYVTSSYLSVAIAAAFGTALSGRSRERQSLAETALPFKIVLPVLPVRGPTDLPHRLFGPLGYKVKADRYPLDETMPDLGPSPYWRLELEHEITLQRLLWHLTVLIPVLDNQKHYWVGDAEVQKLLTRGQSWLGQHPEQVFIVNRYLRHQKALVASALARLLPEEALNEEGTELAEDPTESQLERPLSLNAERLKRVAAKIGASGFSSVLDLGCGEGRLLKELLAFRSLQRIVGVDVSTRALEHAAAHLKLHHASDALHPRISLLHGSLLYRDERLFGFEAATCVEVIEHLDPERLLSFERLTFGGIAPRLLVLTTPNREYNDKFETLTSEQFRHSDHRFEWTRAEFQSWARRVAETYGYSVHFEGIGEEDAALGAPTQMGVFEK